MSFTDGVDPASSGCDPDAMKGAAMDAIDVTSLDIETERVKVMPPLRDPDMNINDDIYDDKKSCRIAALTRSS